MKKNYCFLLVLSIVCVDNTAGLRTTLIEIKESIAQAKNTALYYKPYIINGSLITCASISKKLPRVRNACLMMCGIYSLYSWKKGIDDVKRIKRKYGISYKKASHWNQSSSSPGISFATWRLYDMVGDGCFWPNARCMEHYKDIIKEKMLHDICTGKIIIFDRQGNKISSPTPEDVFKAIEREIDQLSREKNYIKRYTDVYRRVSDAQSFKPDFSAWRILWPNYNRASLLYIDIVTMVERLEVLKEIVGELRVQAGLAGWPSNFK